MRGSIPGLLQRQTGRPVTEHRRRLRRTDTAEHRRAARQTTRTLLNTVSGGGGGGGGFASTVCASRRVCGRGAVCVCVRLIPMQRGYSPCTGRTDVYTEACRGGRSQSSASVAVFFCLFSSLNREAGGKTGTCIVLGASWECQTPDPLLLFLLLFFPAFVLGLQHFAAVIFGSFLEGPAGPSLPFHSLQ